ncbi:MAG: DegT/DnrJ/EryC1/StrS family aminotransferase [Desulfurococcaceae archaeon]
MRKIPIAKPIIDNEEVEAVKNVLLSGELAEGREVALFEKEFAEYIGVKHALAVVNGTAALDLALKALGIREGDEVITTPFTFIATANAILYQGAKPVFADIDIRTYNIDPNDVLEKITGRTKAIIVVHLYGQPADMKPLLDIARDHKLMLIEDAAQAHGAEYMGRKVGSIGDVAIFSFYATKNMTSGEGGVITTNDDEIARKIRIMRNHGQVSKYVHEFLGWNYRMTNIAAAIARVQLRKLDYLNRIRERNAAKLTSGLNGLPYIETPYVMPGVKHVWHQYVIRVKENSPLSRDQLREKLLVKGIETAVHYPIPIHQQPLYRKLGYPQNICLNAVIASRSVLSLPVHPALTENDLDYIISSVREVFET